MIEGIGGEHGWYSWPLAWRVRGLARPARRRPGPAPRPARPARPARSATPLDWWRVEEIEHRPAAAAARRDAAARAGLAGARRRARPGRRARVFRQRALFHPRGLLGHLYWWAVYPFHGMVFGGMQRNIARAAEAAACTRAGV